jgi:hypothetical protein
MYKAYVSQIDFSKIVLGPEGSNHVFIIGGRTQDNNASNLVVRVNI